MPVKPSDKFYGTSKWRSLRRLALQRANWHCENCGASVRAPHAPRVDHVKTRQERPDLELELSNLRVLCSRCDNSAHSEKLHPIAGDRTRRIERFRVRGIDANGWPLDTGG